MNEKTLALNGRLRRRRYGGGSGDGSSSAANGSGNVDKDIDSFSRFAMKSLTAVVTAVVAPPTAVETMSKVVDLQ